MKRLFILLAILLVSRGLSAQTAPTPQPFPGAGGSPQPSTRGRTQTAEPAAPAPSTRPPASQPPATSSKPAAPEAAAPAPAPGGAAAGVPLFPSADYIGTFDAGAGQQFVLYGSNLPYAEIVTYYRTVLKNGGSEVFRAPMPPTHQFTLGRYNEDRMAFPPSVVVKDYTWNNSPGYLHVEGTTERRYKTIIQIVAPGPGQ